MNPEKILEAMCSERELLKNEQIEMERAIHKTIFIFITVCIAFIGIYVDKNIIDSHETRSFVLIALTQFEFMLSLFVISLAYSQNVHAGYIGVLEIKINELCGKTISVYETEIGRRFISSPKGMFFWTTVSIAFCSFSLYAVCLFIAVSEGFATWLPKVILPEFIIVGILLFFNISEASRVEKYALKIMSKLSENGHSIKRCDDFK